jgi:Putative sensor
MSHAHEMPDHHPGFFGVLVDPRAYGALLYMVLSLALGVFYFTWAVTGLSLSVGLFILIIGIPFALLFLASVRAIGWVEGRIVEGLLGAQIAPAAPVERGEGLMNNIKAMLTDGHTWGTLFYMILMLPLGISYFVLAVTFFTTSVALMGGGIFDLATGGQIIQGHVHLDDVPELQSLVAFMNTPGGLVAAIIIGAILFFITMHIARALGWLHARIAEGLLVRG